MNGWMGGQGRRNSGGHRGLDQALSTRDSLASISRRGQRSGLAAKKKSKNGESLVPRHRMCKAPLIGRTRKEEDGVPLKNTDAASRILILLRSGRDTAATFNPLERSDGKTCRNLPASVCLPACDLETR